MLRLHSLEAYESQELRVATDDLFLLRIHFVWEVDIITHDLPKAHRGIHSRYDCTYLVQTFLCYLIFVIDFLPSIIMLIGRIGRTQFGIVVGCITDTGERTVA